MKIPSKEKKDLIAYIDRAISGIDEELTESRGRIKFFIGEKNKLLKIRKCIK